MTSPIERHRGLDLDDVIELQRRSCEKAGSALYAEVLAAMAADYSAGGVVARLLDPHADNAMANAVPLRLLGGLHRLILDGREPALAEWFPSAGGTRRTPIAAAAIESITRHEATLAAGMTDGVQTNEVGRAASLVGAFHEVAARTGLPLRCLEVGSSGGLLQHWDRFAYDNRGRQWGDPESPIRFVDAWTGAGPRWADVEVVERRGCDVAPIDVTTDEGAVRLRSFLWPDQLERRTRLDAAIEVARRDPAPIDRADAGEWIADQLAEPRPGVATVVFHSIVLQYLPRPTFRRLRDELVAAGARASADAPLAWLRMEPAGDHADVTLRCWPGGVDEVLATTAYHGPPVVWPPSRN